MAQTLLGVIADVLGTVPSVKTRSGFNESENGGVQPCAASLHALDVTGMMKEDDRARPRVFSRVGQSGLMILIAATLLGCSESNLETDSPSQRQNETSSNSPAAGSEGDPTISKNGDPNSLVSDSNSPSTGSNSQRADRLQEAERLAEAQRYADSANLLRQQLLADPNDTEVIFRIANVTALLGDLESAIEFLDSISPDDLEAGLPALGQSADWCMALKKYEDAENKYRKILELAPQASIAHRRLALLLNRQGRRHEAATHIQTLCKLGDVQQDELHALIVLSDAMGISDKGTEEASIDSNPTMNQQEGSEVDYSPINDWGTARILFTERKYAEAADLLRASFAGTQSSSETTQRNATVPPAVIAFYGRTLAESQNDADFTTWYRETEKQAELKEQAEYWAAIGTYLASQQKPEPASRSLLEALNRDPTDFRSMNRLHQMLELMGKNEQAKRWENRWKSNREVLLANNAISDSAEANVVAMDEIASQLAGLGRNLEAVLWKMLESYHRGLGTEALNGWNQQREQLVQSNQCFPATPVRLCEMDLEQYALPRMDAFIDPLAASNQPINPISKASDSIAIFHNIAPNAGMTHRYQLSAEPIDSGFAMYHQAGGGVAVLDFDLDGFDDLYFAQGGADAPEFNSAIPNELYRNQSARFIEVADHAKVKDHHYTIGCTAGDWNQDGLPDLVTANIGQNLLLINNGDGTFTEQRIPGTSSLNNMPASIAIADLNGDSIPDLFETNYIDDKNIDLRPDRDQDNSVIEAVGPADFQPSIDRIGLNDQSGGFLFSSLTSESETTYRGLGVVIADFDGDGSNEVFVGNDKSPNQLWNLKLDSTGEIEWFDTAMASGIAFSSDGGGTASMGIAAGDFDRSGTLDLHVANFQNENACLYLYRNQVFQDRATQFRLGVPSYEVLGFGCQGIDFNLDGYLDLAVANGHIDNYQKMSGDFKQRFQLFVNQGNRFSEARWTEDSLYALNMHLGRSMAKLDFDRDGKEDLVITHLNEESALLHNQTQTDHHWLQLQLVGVQSERDAIGAKVTVQFAGQTLTNWVTAGDGYLCKNHNVICFGLGDASQVDNIRIQWPSGTQQDVKIVTVDQRIVIVENLAQIHSFAN